MQMVLLAALAARTTNALTAQVAPKAAVISEHRFRQLCEAAVRCGRPVEMQGRRVALTDTFRVMRQDELTIHGPGRIDGSGHSVFQIEGNGNTLTLRDLDLRHQRAPDRAEKRSLGACVFARGRGSVKLQRCRVTSEAGFGLWLVQRARAVLHECEVIDPGRTAVAVFNVAKLDVSNSTIQGGDQHGVCMRGEAYASIRDSRVVGAKDRACYAYMSARLELVRTEVSADDATCAAIQCEALRPRDAAMLVLDDVVVSPDNKGRGCSVAGNVALTLLGSNELRGPIDDEPAVVRDPFAEPE